MEPRHNADYIVSHVPELQQARDSGQLFTYDILLKDSTNMTYTDRKKIFKWGRRAIKQGADGMASSHGTDKIKETLVYLTLAFPWLDRPWIFTGSNEPIDAKGTDAKAHMRGAYYAACDERFPGVYIYAQNRLLRGIRADESEHMTFTSPKYPVIAEWRKGHFEYTPEGKKAQERYIKRMQKYARTDKQLSFTYPSRAVKRAAVVQLYDGMDAKELSRFGDKDALILLTRGRSGISEWFLDTLRAWAEKGKLVGVGSDTGREMDLTTYRVGVEALEAGVIPIYDMDKVAALEKAKFALYLTNNPKKRRQVMLHNCFDEIRELTDKEWEKLGKYAKDLRAEEGEVEAMIIDAFKICKTDECKEKTTEAIKQSASGIAPLN